jgi:hypothetical protein
MTAAIFGLVGVIIGGVINFVVTAFLQRRTERSDRRSAARLVRSELVRFRSLALAAARSSPDHLPQLRDATPMLWQSHRATIARALSDEQWGPVALAYAHVDALVSVLVFEPDGRLEEWRGREAQRLFAGMIGPVEEAAAVLSKAAGAPSDRSDFPDEGPVAA